MKKIASYLTKESIPVVAQIICHLPDTSGDSMHLGGCLHDRANAEVLVRLHKVQICIQCPTDQAVAIVDLPVFCLMLHLQWRDICHIQRLLCLDLTAGTQINILLIQSIRKILKLPDLVIHVRIGTEQLVSLQEGTAQKDPAHLWLCRQKLFEIIDPLTRKDIKCNIRTGIIVTDKPVLLQNTYDSIWSQCRLLKFVS